MQKQSNLFRLKRRTIFPLAVILLALIGVTPVLADYLGPHRTVTETDSEMDNRAPEIRMPDAWFQWDTVILNVWDNESGLSEVDIEITDPKGCGPVRVIQLNPQQFPIGFNWDRRLGDNTIAEVGIYDVKVTAFDNVGNTAYKNASIRILLDIMPIGRGNNTLQSYLPEK